MPTTSLWRRFLALSVALTLALATVVLTGATQPAEARKRQTKKILHSARVAVNQVGDPYRYGADGPRAFDCSGLTSFAYKRANLYLPRSSDAQARFARHIKRKNLKRGDLMFFYDGGGVYHVAMFLKWKHKRRVMLHAPYGGHDVTRAKPWTNKWFAGTVRRR